MEITLKFWRFLVAASKKRNFISCGVFLPCRFGVLDCLKRLSSDQCVPQNVLKFETLFKCKI